MPQSIVIDQFEGPLGLLLELVERNQMEVTNIAVATITAQYLASIANLELTPEVLGEFLQLGTRLTYIKSLALLPGVEPEEQTELAKLGHELTEYRRYQAAARVLASRAARPNRPRPVSEHLDELPLPALDLAELAKAFQAALRRVEPALPGKVLVSQLSQHEVLTSLIKRLQSGPFELSQLLDNLRDRLEVIVTFSALLELIRDGRGQVVQADQFGPIIVEPVQ